MILCYSDPVKPTKKNINKTTSWLSVIGYLNSSLLIPRPPNPSVVNAISLWYVPSTLLKTGSSKVEGEQSGAFSSWRVSYLFQVLEDQIRTKTKINNGFGH